MKSVFAIIFLILAPFYFVYQFFRNDMVFWIRKKWIYEDDERWYKYSYDEMFDPNINNWFGLRWPNEKNYK